jgi:phosphocarrier protein
MARSKNEPSVAKGYFTVKNDRGLHTRPSTELVKCAGQFRSQITLTFRKNRVNAKSVLGILMLAAPKRARIRIEAEGVDAPQAVEKLCDLAANNFNIKY